VPRISQDPVSDNAVTADGSKLGHTDPNIMNGLDVAYVSDRILASAHCGLDEIWIAKWSELRSAYLSQYAPGSFKRKARDVALASVGHTMGEVFVKERLASKL